MNHVRKTRQTKPSLNRIPSGHLWETWARLSADLQGIADCGVIDSVASVVRRRDLSLIKHPSDEWGLQCMPSKELWSPTRVEANQLLSRMASKYVSDSDAKRLHDAALESFAEVDREVGLVYLSEHTLRRMKEVITAICGDAPTSERLGAISKHGSGSSAGVSYARRFAFHKWNAWPYDMTPATRPILQQIIEADDRWHDAIDQRLRREDGIPLWAPYSLSFSDSWVSLRRSNVVTSVPKDSSKRRTIAKEPTYSMFIQLGLHELLAQRLRRITGIDIRDSSRNRILARQGSYDHFGYLSPVTIDLSEASDRLSLNLIEQVFPADWVAILKSCRSEFSELPTKSVLLNKYASMGNGTTFIVQTIVYYALCVIAQERSDRFYPDLTAVYGDDIILPRFASQHLYALLRAAGLKVNVEKSFTSGPVRETCGVDWYNGHNVRPVFYRRDYVDDLQGYLAFRNLLWLWSTETGIELNSTLEYLDSYLNEVPDGFSKPDVTSCRFTCPGNPLKDGLKQPILTWSAKSIEIPAPVTRGEGFLFAKLCATIPTAFAPSQELGWSAPRESVGKQFTVGTGTARVRRTVAPFRFVPDVSRATLSISFTE